MVCRIHTLVGVMSLRLAVLEYRLSHLLHERAELCMPISERCDEGRLVGLGEREDKRHERFSCLGLRSLRKVSSDDFDLMKLAHLHRNIVENVEESSSSVDHRKKDGPFFFFENLPAIAIVRHEFFGDFVPPNILLEWPCTKDTDTVVPTPECSISDDAGRVRNDLRSRYDDCIELFAHPDVRVVVFSSELFERLLAFDVFLPEFDSNAVVSPR